MEHLHHGSQDLLFLVLLLQDLLTLCVLPLVVFLGPGVVDEHPRLLPPRETLPLLVFLELTGGQHVSDEFDGVREIRLQLFRSWPGRREVERVCVDPAGRAVSRGTATGAPAAAADDVGARGEEHAEGGLGHWPSGAAEAAEPTEVWGGGGC